MCALCWACVPIVLGVCAPLLDRQEVLLSLRESLEELGEAVDDGVVAERFGVMGLDRDAERLTVPETLEGGGGWRVGERRLECCLGDSRSGIERPPSRRLPSPHLDDDVEEAVVIALSVDQPRCR